MLRPYGRRAFFVEEFQEVDGGEVAGGVVQVHVLRAGVGGVDAAAVGAGVPVVDGGVVRQAGVGALPGGLGDAAHELAGAVRLGGLAGGDVAGAPLAVHLNGAHEVVGHAYGVVGVLVLDAYPGVAVQGDVVAGVAQGVGLALLLRLAVDELLDVGVAYVEDDHLGGASGLAAGLDGAGDGVGAAHEGDRPGGEAAGGEPLLRGAQAREVDARAGAALEDLPLGPVPLQDGVHGVVYGEDEAGGALGLLFDAQVEPDGRVEAGLLVDQDGLELRLERLRFVIVREVLPLSPPLRDGVDYAVYELLDGALADGGGLPRRGGGEDRPHP